MKHALDHPWDLPIEEAVLLQRQIRTLVQPRNSFQPDALRTVAGVDASYKDQSRAAVVVLSYPDLLEVDRAVAVRPTSFPYVPGLLSFREIPAVLDALDRLRVQPDLLMVDGHGQAHHRRLGIASHLGVYLDLPTIGCAKSRLVGKYAEPGPAPGDESPLTQKGEVIGMVIRSKARTNPLFISVGHRVDLATAVQIVRHCLRGYRLPEPTRLADRLSKDAYPM